ncbi:MAG: mechanosensitive ion channel family protein [Candidatus Micrarchaeota archaeon]|nr:mechanosensitive ion channel family protein [Candidatus Micrarchaeota archaeon]
MEFMGLSFTSELFGNTLMQYGMLLGTVLLFVLLSKGIYYFIKTYVRRLTEKTKTDLDDMLIDIIEHPITMLVMIGGLYFGTVLYLTPATPAYDFINSIFKILVIINVAWFILRVIDTLVVHYFKPYVEKSESKLDDQLLPILRRGIKVVIVILTLVFLLSNFGYDVTALVAGLGVGGLAVALAAQDTISNFIGSLVIFTGKPFKIGDFVKFGSFAGTVQEVGMRTTRFETPSGTMLVVPNNKISNEIVENVTAAKSRRVDIVIGITYGTSYAKLKRAIGLVEGVLKMHPNVERCDVRFSEFGAYALNISAWYWLRDPSKLRETAHEVNLEIKRVLDKEKVEMAFPTQTVYVKR